MFTIPSFPPDVPTDLDAFLATEPGTKWIDNLAKAYPHTNYERDRSTSYTLKQCDQYAAAIIDAKRQDLEIAECLQDELRPASFGSTWHHWVKPDLKPALRNQFNNRDLEEEWAESLRYAWEERAAEADDSTVTDLLGSYDYCQLLFRFSQGEYVEDTMIVSHKPWSDPSELAVTDDLQFALNNLGYTIGQFRAACHNKHKAYKPLKTRRARRKPIIDPAKLREAIENACSQYFHFYLFAIVPITDLIALDLANPITFDKCWVATANCYSGTFHDVPASGPVTVNPTDGVLLSGAQMAYSPDEVCGLYTPHYHANVRN
jgi:hypothetical protein